MSLYATKCFDIDKTSLKADTGELARRLFVDRKFDMSVFDEYIKKAHDKVNARCVSICVPVKVSDGQNCDLGFLKVKSRDLAKNLEGCGNAFVFAVTLGMDTERYLRMLSKTDTAEHFVCDGYYSALCESACDFAENELCASDACKVRFSPGYGDLPLPIQKEIIEFLGKSQNLGITLTDSLLMIPQKSVTAIKGIINQQ